MRHDFQIAHHSGLIRGSLMPILAVTLFCIFVIIAIVNTFVLTRDYEVEIIERDVNKLSEAIAQIEKDCKIYSVENKINDINFLNVKSFVGSTVGPINLKHPDRWKGPYMDRNPSIQGKEYLLVRTKQGYFITPGRGVKLPNGKVIGTDIKFEEDSDIQAMMKDETKLNYKGKALAAPVTIKKRGPYYIPNSPLNYTY